MRPNAILPALALAFLLAPAAAAQEPIALGEQRQGRMTRENAGFEEGSFVRHYRFEGRPGVRYIATSTDSYVSLTRGTGVDDEVMSVDGYEGPTPGSHRIQFRLGDTAVYLLRVETNDTTSFALALDSLPSFVPEARDIAVGATMEGALETGDGEMDPLEGGFYDLYRFEASPESSLCVRMSSHDFDPILRIGVLENDAFVVWSDRGEMSDEDGPSEIRFLWNAPVSRTYHLRATAPRGVTAAYRIVVEPAPGGCPTESGEAAGR